MTELINQQQRIRAVGDRMAWVAGLALIALSAGLAWCSSALVIGEPRTLDRLVPFVALQMIAGAVYLAFIARARQGRVIASLPLVIVVGVAMRAVLWAAPPALEDDFFRYQLDGAVTAHGLNPYAASPNSIREQADPARAELLREPGAAEAVSHIAHGQWRTIYPPVMQAAFAAAYVIDPWHIAGLRVVIGVADAVTMLLLLCLLRDLRLPLWYAAIYWWNPLLVKEFTSGVHADALVLPLIVLVLFAVVHRRILSAAVVIAVAAGVKLWPVVLMPLALRAVCTSARRRWIALALFVLLSVGILSPLLLTLLHSDSGLAAYARSWENNSGIFRVVLGLMQFAKDPHRVARYVTSAMLAAWLLWLLRTPPATPRDWCRLCLLAVAGLFLLSPTQFPWYYTWLVPLLAVTPRPALLLYTALLPLYHFQALTPWVVAVQHAPVIAWLAGEAWVARRRIHNCTDESATTIDTDTAGFPPTAVIIPALNEERAIGLALADLPPWVRRVIVVDNGSTDRTAEVARSAGALVVTEPRRGYGSACLAGIKELRDEQVVVFMDGDYSDHPQEIGRLVAPIAAGRAELVIGSRVMGKAEAGALTHTQRFGNWLSCWLLRLVWGVRHTDLGPFRAIRVSTLRSLGMSDRDYGWTVQMQARAARLGVAAIDVPVSYRRRIGVSKISGTIRGVIGAGTKILFTIAREALAPRGTPRLIVFTRYPEPGRVKTRLIPTLGEQGACHVHERLTEFSLSVARAVRSAGAVDIDVQFAGGSAEQMATRFGSDLTYRMQVGGDLGNRLEWAHAEAFAAGHSAVVIIGSDCPGLGVGTVHDALDILHDHDVVLGPANDGGYYLIALKNPAPLLFHGIAWGTENVLAQTRAAAARLGLRVILLPMLNDVDRPEDVPDSMRPRPEPTQNLIANGA